MNGTDENASVEEGREEGGVEGDEVRHRPKYKRSVSSSRDYNYIGDELDDPDDDSGLPKPFPTGTERKKKIKKKNKMKKNCSVN